MSKRTLVVGASTNPSRYSNKAIRLLRDYKHETYGLGLKEAKVEDVEILTGEPEIKNVDTVSMYLNPQNSEEEIEYILSLKPKRIIFNPGSENESFMNQAAKEGIEVVMACTLVMLRTDQY